MLSEVSPQSASTSTTRSGPTPNFSNTSGMPKLFSFMVSSRVTCSETICIRSLSPVTTTHAIPSASHFLAMVPMMSSASKPGSSSAGMLKARTICLIGSICWARSSGMVLRVAL